MCSSSRAVSFVVVALVSGLALPAFAQAPEPVDGGVAMAFSVREQFEWDIRNQPRGDFLDACAKSISALGTYRYKMAKQERVDGTLLDLQEIVTTVREEPFAIRLEYVGGPGKGRRILFNPGINAERFRVRESGFLSIVGAIWLDVGSGFAKKESNHTVRDGGMGSLLRRFRRDFQRGESQGGFPTNHEGWNLQGSWCSLYYSPNKGVGYDSYSTRICNDPQTRLPTKVEGYDVNGALLERYVFATVDKVDLPAAYFTLEGAGL